MTTGAGAGAGNAGVNGGSGGGGTGEGGAGGAAGQELADMVNAAAQAQLRRLLPKALSEALGGALKPFEEKLALLQPKQEEPAAGKEPAAQQKPADDPRIAALLRKQEAMEKQLAESEAKRQASEKAATDTRIASNLRDALNGKVRPETLPMAVRLLRADGRVRADESGNAVFVDADGVEMKLEEGLKTWLKTQEGLVFVPAPSPVAGGKKGNFTPRRGADGNPVPEKPAEKAGRVLNKMGITTVT